MSDIAYSSQVKLMYKVLVVLLGVLLLISIAANGYLFNRLPQSTTTLPVNIKSPSVKSAGTLYLIEGIVNKATSQGSNISIGIQDSQGVIVPYKFIISDASSNIVEKKGNNEEKVMANTIKNGQSIELNYYFDLKTNQGQVTKVIITNN